MDSAARREHFNGDGIEQGPWLLASPGRPAVVTVNSEVLGERVLFVSDNALLDPGELRPVYRAHELRVLLGLRDPGELRRIHEFKETFRGTITDWLPSCPHHKACTSKE